MKLSRVIEGIEIIGLKGPEDPEISGISYDSRKVRTGDLFVAAAGANADGIRFIPDAAGRGASAVLYDREDYHVPPDLKGVTFVRVGDSRAALAAASNNFFRRPSFEMDVIGVTGTNGKTTTTYIIRSILNAWGKKVGLIGTIQSMIGEDVFESVHTTPEAVEFQGFLRRMKDAGCACVVTEVSSHALAQRRVDGTAFRAAVFTNLTRDHLDYHEDMEHYFEAKKRLFTDLLSPGGGIVINTDDPYGRRLATDMALQAAGSGGRVATFGLEPGAAYIAREIGMTFGGLEFSIVAGDSCRRVRSPLVGLFNVYNILAAAAVSDSIGVPWEAILSGIMDAGDVKGRFEKVETGLGFLAIVDYAHTEDALERLILTARGLASGKVITVFGCGGDRDRGKRPVMGAVATRLSDFVLITSDNPRSEDPLAIIGEIEAGAVRKNYMIEPDRKEAIRRAVLMAGQGDILLVAGKGHEDYQEIGGVRHVFSDRLALDEACRQAALKKGMPEIRE